MIASRLQFVTNPPSGRMGWWGVGLAAAATAAVLWISARGAQISAQNLFGGVPYMWDFLARMMPPNLGFMEKLWRPALESLYVAIWGTILGVFIAMPFCFFAARNLSPSPAVYHLMRQILNAMRGVNEIILALVFVAAIGLGPFAGVLALGVHGAGMLGKFFAEAIEDIDEGPIEAFKSAGVGRFKTILFGIVPQVADSSAHRRDPARSQGGLRAPDHGRNRPVLEGLAPRGEPLLRRLVPHRAARHQG